jgi:hypothetical protein
MRPVKVCRTAELLRADHGANAVQAAEHCTAVALMMTRQPAINFSWR